MRLRGEQQLDVSPDRFWELVLDPDHVVHAIPGATAITQESTHHYTGTINRSLSGISIEMAVTVSVIEDARPERIECRFHGDDSGTNSSVSGTISLAATPVSNDSAKVTYVIDWELLGRVASIGSRMVKRQLQHDLSSFFTTLNDQQSTTTSTN